MFSDAAILNVVVDALTHEVDDRLQLAISDRLYEPAIEARLSRFMFIDGRRTCY